MFHWIGCVCPIQINFRPGPININRTILIPNIWNWFCFSSFVTAFNFQAKSSDQATILSCSCHFTWSTFCILLAVYPVHFLFIFSSRSSFNLFHLFRRSFFSEFYFVTYFHSRTTMNLMFHSDSSNRHLFLLLVSPSSNLDFSNRCRLSNVNLRKSYRVFSDTVCTYSKTSSIGSENENRLHDCMLNHPIFIFLTHSSELQGCKAWKNFGMKKGAKFGACPSQFSVLPERRGHRSHISRVLSTRSSRLATSFAQAPFRSMLTLVSWNPLLQGHCLRWHHFQCNFCSICSCL